MLPAAVATGVDAAVGEGVVNAGRHSQTLQASSSTNQYGVMTELIALFAPHNQHEAHVLPSTADCLHTCRLPSCKLYGIPYVQCSCITCCCLCNANMCQVQARQRYGNQESLLLDMQKRTGCPNRLTACIQCTHVELTLPHW